MEQREQGRLVEVYRQAMEEGWDQVGREQAQRLRVQLEEFLRSEEWALVHELLMYQVMRQGQTLEDAGASLEQIRGAQMTMRSLKEFRQSIIDLAKQKE
jgi:hypothetical protein